MHRTTKSALHCQSHRTARTCARSAARRSFFLTLSITECDAGNPTSPETSLGRQPERPGVGDGRPPAVSFGSAVGRWHRTCQARAVCGMSVCSLKNSDFPWPLRHELSAVARSLGARESGWSVLVKRSRKRVRHGCSKGLHVDASATSSRCAWAPPAGRREPAPIPRLRCRDPPVGWNDAICLASGPRYPQAGLRACFGPRDRHPQHGTGHTVLLSAGPDGAPADGGPGPRTQGNDHDKKLRDAR